MDAQSQTPASLVHFYDTRTHAIPCGENGPDRRSTKHPRQVTCQSCVALFDAPRALADDAGAVS